MNTTLESIESAAKLLSISERATLVHNLLRDLEEPEGDEKYIESLWVSEAEDRLDAYLNGGIKSSPVSEVVTRVRSRIGR